VLVETVFVWPGLGRLLYDAVLARDTPMLTGLLLFSATIVVTANVIADVLYRVLDPRTGFR
jgi:peptide/nickel transport system permease protein